ncbi:MAG: DUF2255 family protein [Candidatus Eisenbacteria bacterium]|uniref:DUF2255 family protein n=1 Tax=Eiseniibacteriota bacterium TaxID=2212470 RepID=A0A7Y2EAT2_UNCEI|nr:DUF2255 family protein [Candidatus Eisenbacteria bacterium]
MGIKGGTSRKTFLDIWMVEVDGRVFARSWSKSERSWFTTFLNEKVGQIRFGTIELDVRGEKLPSDSHLHQRINQAYLDKYTQPENVPYAQGISKPEYENFTMEFFAS